MTTISQKKYGRQLIKTISIEQACDLVFEWDKKYGGDRVTAISDFGDFYIVFTRSGKEDEFGMRSLVNKETGKISGIPFVVMIKHWGEIKDLELPEKYKKLLEKLEKEGK